MSIQLSATSLAALFDEVTRSLCEHLTERSEILPRESRWIEVEAADAESLLQKWIDELLLVAETEGTLFRHSESSLDNENPPRFRLRGHLWGEPLDPNRHLRRESAPTRPFSRPLLRHDSQGWHAEVDFAPTPQPNPDNGEEDPLAAAGGLAGG